MRPNTFILGAAKCATSTLHNWLGQHSNICVDLKKEPMFFNRDIYDKGFEWLHKKHYSHYNNEDIVIDSSTYNLLVPYVVPRIKESIENPKFIVMVREPISRAYSHWSMIQNYRPGRTYDTFLETINNNFISFKHNKFKVEGDFMPYTDYKGGCYIPSFIEQGLYHTQIARYINAFGRENIHIIVTDDMKTNGKQMYQGVLNFLMLNNEDIEFNNVRVAQNFNMIGKYEDSQIIKKLRGLYFNEIYLLGKLINRNLLKEWGYSK